MESRQNGSLIGLLWLVAVVIIEVLLAVLVFLLVIKQA